MILGYIMMAMRILRKRKLYSFINVFGLSISLSCCLLIYLFILDEKSFDGFHVNKHAIFRMEDKKFNFDNPGSDDPYIRSASLPAGFRQALLDEIPEVTHATRFNSGYNSVLRYADKVFAEQVTYVDSDFFSMFSFQLISGHSKKLFTSKGEVVLTPAVARKYFGDKDPIGKTILIGSRSDPFTVTGLIEEPPANSSLQFSVLLPQENRNNYQNLLTRWTDSNSPTFVQLASGPDLEKFRQNLHAFMRKYQGDRLERSEKMRREASLPEGIALVTLDFTALPDMHWKKQTEWYKVSDPVYSMILGGIGLLILVISCINYISLALTMSSTRRKEVGVRKVVGASLRQLFSQFVTESIILVLSSLIIGIATVALVLPAFNKFIGRQITVQSTDIAGFVIVGLVLVLMVVLAGLYPVSLLSRFRPATVLKGNGPRVHTGMAKPLVLLQFVVSSSLIIAAIVMNRQMQFVALKDLGYEKEAVLVIPAMAGRDEANKVVQRFRMASQGESSILSVSGTSATFDGGTWRHDFEYNGEKQTAFLYAVDPYYIETMGLELLQGRNFDASIASDTNAIIVNEAMVRTLGWTNPLSETLTWTHDDGSATGDKVIGVVKDYHYLPLNYPVNPVILSINKRKVGYHGVMHVKVSAGNVPAAVAAAERVWKNVSPDKPFTYSFLDDKLSIQYRSYQQWTDMMSIATVLAIVIASMGLFGLSGINTVNRTKEIGIRKILGARLTDIFLLMNKEYVWMASAAFVIAAPFCGYVMDQWLSTFTFHIELSWKLFALSMISALGIALLAVSYHTIKTALIDPSVTVRHE